ncbi:hypothetical protein H263_16008, partial [Brachyspira hampsonii 30599]
LFFIIIYKISYSYELRLYFSRSYIYDDMLYVDVRLIMKMKFIRISKNI